MNRLLAISLFFLLFVLRLNTSNSQTLAQTLKRKESEAVGVSSNHLTGYGTVMQALVIDGDTVPVWNLREIKIYSPRVFKTDKEAKNYGRLLRDVKKAYPYAKVASGKLKEYNENLARLDTEKKRKLYLKIAEKELKAEFEEDLKKLTIRQGRILIKLVDRETGNSSYELVKELRGSFSAFLWQSLAKMFGTDLKAKYDPKGEDKLIEEIIILIENGDV